LNYINKNSWLADILSNLRKYSLYLNEMGGVAMRLAPAGPHLSAPKIAPRDFVRKNLAANPERSPLMQYTG
jgi:hypothetical protein